MPPLAAVPFLERLLLLGALLLLFGVGAGQVHSFDLFWQLQSGRYILETGRFIYHDIFSLAADAPRYEHCWLHDILFYGAWKVAGYHGISLLKGVVVFALGAVAALTALHRGASPLSVCAVTIPAVLLTAGGWLERPQLWTFLFFLLFIYVLDRYRRTPGSLIWVLVPLMILWANLHAGSVMAFPIVAAWLAGEGAKIVVGRSDLPRGAYRRLWGVALCLPVAALCTPYGLQTLKTLVSAHRHGVASGMITQLYNMDWVPTTFSNSPHFFYAMAFTAAVLILCRRRVDPSELFLLAGVCWMGLELGRHTTFLFLGIAALLPNYVEGALSSLAERLRRVPALRALGWAVTLLIVLHFARPAYAAYGFFETGLREWHYPVGAAQFVREHRLPANLYNTYDWGGYLMWTLYPDYLVFWDGRSDSLEMFEHGLRIMRGDPGWEQTLERFDVRTVVTKTCTVDTGERYPLVDRLRESPEWTLVFADVSALIFVRDDSVPAKWLARHKLPMSRIDDTILSEAALLAQAEPRRFMAWWEIARIHWSRGEHRQAFAALEKHLSLAPEGGHHPLAETYFRLLYPMIRAGGGTAPAGG